MKGNIVIRAKDVELRIDYVYLFSRYQGTQIINAKQNDVINLGDKGSWIQINENTITIRRSTGGGRVDLNKKIVLKQIANQLYEDAEF